tara:strand:+ start:166187 stop:166906 length:720 start_codon:yes stop_codon:yes gene_type:complete
MNELTPRDNDKTSGFLAETFHNLIEGITGVASSEKKELYLSVGYILQRMRNGNFVRTFKGEWDKYRDKGKIKDDYLDSDQHQECLQEMLDFLDNDSPDNVRFSVLKNVFLNAATEDKSSRDDLLPQQLMRICRSLNSTEVLILQACYKLNKKNMAPASHSAKNWRSAIVQNSDLRFRELVESHETSLEDKGLIHRRSDPDKSHFSQLGHFRLTGLGIRLCEFMTEHEPDTTDSGNNSND